MRDYVIMTDSCCDFPAELARELELGQSHPDEDEFLEVVKLPLAQAADMAGDGRLEDCKTVAAILRACRVLERERNG